MKVDDSRLLTKSGSQMNPQKIFKHQKKEKILIVKHNKRQSTNVCSILIKYI